MDTKEDVLPNCSICGSPPKEEDFGAVAEYYGHAWQEGDITCSSTGTVKGCSNGVSISFEADATLKPTEKLRAMWRILNS